MTQRAKTARIWRHYRVRLQVNILRELRHPFIVRYYDRIIDKASTKIYIVMECCEGGDLGNVVKACKRDGFVGTRALLKCCSGVGLAVGQLQCFTTTLVHMQVHAPSPSGSAARPWTRSSCGRSSRSSSWR